MNINYKQSQFELFPGAGENSIKTARPAFLFASVTLTLENIVVAGIVMLLATVLSFSIGVERGKKVAFASTSAMRPLSPADTTVAVTPIRKNSIETSATKSAVMPKPSVIPPSPKGAVVDIAVKGTPKKSLETMTASPVLQNAMGQLSSYTIQVASFAKGEYAKKEASILAKKGFDNFVVSKGKYSIVCVGKFVKKDEANVTLTRLQKTYKDCMIRRL